MKNERMDEPITTIRFLICRNCFWCASLIEWRSESYEQVERHVTTHRDNMYERCGKEQVKSIPVSWRNRTKWYITIHIILRLVRQCDSALTLQEATRIGNGFISFRNHNSIEDGYLYIRSFTIKLTCVGLPRFCTYCQQGKTCAIHSSRCMNDCSIRRRGLAANRLSFALVLA